MLSRCSLANVDEIDSERQVPPYPIESVDRALALVRMLSERPEVKLSEVRTQLGVGQSTAHRLLAMFVYRGFAVRNPETRTYRAGPVLLSLNPGRDARLDVARVIRPALSRLTQETGETTHFGILDGVDVRFLEVVESTQVLRVSGRKDQHRPAHATSIGRAMLATEPDEMVRNRYRGSDLRANSGGGAKNMETLLDELRQTRRRGYARNRGDVEPGVCSVGVAVTSPEGDLLGGISVAAPEYRWSTSIEKAYVGLLQHLAAGLGGTLP